MKHLLQLSTLLLLLSLGGCDTVTQALSELDDLKIILNKDLGEVTTELEKWRRDLPDNVRNLIDDDINKLSQDIIGSTGKETRCTLDFLRTRFVQSVENIKLKLLHKPIVIQKPCFCTLSLPMINPNNDSKSIESVNFYGYDLSNLDSTKNLIKAILVGDSASVEIDDAYIGRTSNYQMAINIIDILPEVASNKYHKIKLFWNGDSTGLSEVLIATWNPDVKLIPFQSQAISWYPPHTGGRDSQLDTDPGNWANGQIELQIRVNGNSIESRVFYDVMEFGGDNTRFGINAEGEESAWSAWKTIYTNSELNYELIGFSPTVPTRFSFTVTDQVPKHYYQGGSAVSQFEAFIDQAGDDLGYPHVNVVFNGMQAMVKRKKPTRSRP